MSTSVVDASGGCRLEVCSAPEDPEECESSPPARKLACALQPASAMQSRPVRRAYLDGSFLMMPSVSRQLERPRRGRTGAFRQHGALYAPQAHAAAGAGPSPTRKLRHEGDGIPRAVSRGLRPEGGAGLARARLVIEWSRRCVEARTRECAPRLCDSEYRAARHNSLSRLEARLRPSRQRSKVHALDPLNEQRAS